MCIKITNFDFSDERIVLLLFPNRGLSFPGLSFPGLSFRVLVFQVLVTPLSVRKTKTEDLTLSQPKIFQHDGCWSEADSLKLYYIRMLDVLFLRKQCRQRYSQCSSPRKQDRKNLCQSHLCRPDHSSKSKGDPWPNMRLVGLFS